MSELPYESFIRSECTKESVSPEVVSALIIQESNGNPWAFRYEDGFFERYINNKLPATLGGVWQKGEISIDSEKRLRAFSFGLMQIMGQTAREAGFEGYLPELFNPEVNIKLGCKILGSNLRYYKGDYRKALSAYNSGRGWVDRYGATVYADKTLARIETDEIGKIITI